MGKLFLFFVCLASFLISHVAAVGNIMSSSAGSTGARYATLTSHYTGGIKNVRWETVPANVLDENGKPMPIPGNTDCLDVTGKQQPNGSEYTRKNGKFKYKCNNGIEEVIACKTSARAGEKWIGVGEDVTADGFWHKCISYPNGSVIYTQEDSCLIDGKAYHDGDEARLGYLKIQCTGSGYKIVGCTFTEDNKNFIDLKPGENRVIDRTSHSCIEKDGTLQYSATGNGCMKGGKVYKEGETFTDHNLRYECNNGFLLIAGCEASNGTPLSPGQQITNNEKKVNYKCSQIGDMVEYEEAQCGMPGLPVCSSVNHSESTNTKGPLNKATLRHPGYSAFSIVQIPVGTKPGSVQLSLDKFLAANAQPGRGVATAVSMD